MKKTVLILSFILVSIVSFAQRQRTTAVFDSDTTTRPKAGFYGIGVRSNNIYFVPPTGNNIRLANYSLFTGLGTNYLPKWNGSKLVNSQLSEAGGFVNSYVPNFILSGTYPTIYLNGTQANNTHIHLRNYVGGVSNSGFEIYDNTNLVSRLAISGSGNVGIGTASPSAKFHLDFSTTSQNGLLVNNAENSSYFNLYQNGSVAFGVPNWPNATLLESVATGGLVLGSFSNKIIFQTGNRANHSVFDFSGNFGIGTNTPTSKLQVVGLPTYADNAAATSAGLTAGAFYRTSTGVLMVVY